MVAKPSFTNITRRKYGKLSSITYLIVCYKMSFKFSARLCTTASKSQWKELLHVEQVLCPEWNWVESSQFRIYEREKEVSSKFASKASDFFSPIAKYVFYFTFFNSTAVNLSTSSSSVSKQNTSLLFLFV